MFHQLNSQSMCVRFRNIYRETEQINNKLSINMKKHYLSLLLLLLVEGVFSEVKISVMEEESVTLQIDVTEIQGAETLLWTFNDSNKFIAKIDRETNNEITIPGNDDGRFNNRLQVDKSGSLTITNIRTADSGLYKLEIRSSRGSSYKSFSVTVYSESGVETVSVMEGDSVTLHTDLTEILRDELLLWKFDNTRIANINREENQFSVYDGTDGKFRGKLELDSRTGSLKIRDIRTEHSGLYELQISSIRATKHKRFIVIVTEYREP
ncbi:uncharacterized protein LOC127439156 isoform X2 [Myxocyprinus asiaticus]|uniref:uncharacterized protein LOC127439156 isoform X2 n=1 Tax=Myxocyprinus asiaticus TaxID=70543 RepID=UPI0022215B46|nr:uncharacterized protein LOC127439156 isoform X2 [Myxocyprinus asiaticus]